MAALAADLEESKPVARQDGPGRPHSEARLISTKGPSAAALDAALDFFWPTYMGGISKAHARSTIQVQRLAVAMDEFRGQCCPPQT